jgi:Ca-activated chloride channel family protein
MHQARAVLDPLAGPGLAAAGVSSSHLGRRLALAARLALVGSLAAAVAGCAMQGTSSSDSSGGGVGFGGAQDIGQFRSIVERGELPAPGTLDANGFFAEHFVELPPPTCGQVLCVNPMLARGRNWITGAPRTTLQLALTTPTNTTALPRRPRDLVLVVDRSGSMSEDARMSKVQRGLRLLAEQLRADDRVALVTFETATRLEVPFGAPRSALRSAIDALRPEGGTNLHDGLRLGLELAAGQLSAERESRVILLSDGLASVGITDAATITSMAERHIHDGIGLSTIGVGRSFDVSLMRGLAERGAGNYYFLEDAAAVDEVFTQELEISMTPLALEVVLGVQAPFGITLGTVTGRAGWKGTSQLGSLEIPAVFATTRDGMTPGEGRRGGGGALFVDITGDIAGAGDQLVRVELSYRLPGATSRITQSVLVAPIGAPGNDAPLPEVSHQAMLKHAAMYELYLGLRAATERASQRSSCSVATLSQLRTSADVWNQIFEDEDITADLLLVDQLLDTLRKRGYRESPAPINECLADEVHDPYPGDSYGDDDMAYRHCSAGSAASGVPSLALMLLAVAGLRRRRRVTA